MWFWYSLAALLCWSGSDLFSKLGCRDAADKYSHLRMISAVGLVMGLHAAYSLTFGGVELTWDVVLTYLPVSLLYIFSMALGYIGLRYIELSLSSPVCNSSGALVALASILAGGAAGLVWQQLAAMAVVCVGVVALGIIEATEDDELRAARQEASNFKYAKSWKALALPVAYCLLDAAGTFADSIVLETLPEEAANTAYELTFLAAGIAAFIYVRLIKRSKPIARLEPPKFIGAVLETAGQFAYVFALADTAHVALSAPMISAYCAASVVWSRVFLKEKLSVKHYACVAAIVAGVAVLGAFDP